MGRVSGAGKTKHGKTIDGVYERLTINTDEYRLAVKELYNCSLGQCERVYGEPYLPRSPFSFGYDDEIENNKREILKNIYMNKRAACSSSEIQLQCIECLPSGPHYMKATDTIHALVLDLGPLWKRLTYQRLRHLQEPVINMR